MTQNVRQFGGVLGDNPLNNYSPDRIPYEAMMNYNPMQMTNPEFNDLIKHVKKIHDRRNEKARMDQREIREKLLQYTRVRGMSDAEGEGFWGDVWSGIKKAGSWVLNNPDKIMDAVGHIAPLVSSVL